MRLLKFKVTNFRSVIDSGWIDAERVTALIGVNESGKTNLLLPLWKLNPAREGEIKPTSDYPKGNFAAVRANPGSFVFVTARFDVAELAAHLSSITGVKADHLSVVDVSRTFDGEYHLEFPKYKPALEIEIDVVRDLVDSAIDDINAIPVVEGEKATKDALLEALEAAKNMVASGTPLNATRIAEIADALKDALPKTPAANSSIVPRFNRLLASSDSLQSQLNVLQPARADGVKDFLIEALPRFVYYSNYGNLDSEIYLPHVVENLKREDLGAREAAKARTLRVLFSFVQLEPEEVLEMGRDFRHPEGKKPSEAQIAEIATKKRERTILLNSAGTDLTKRFRDWWKQGDYTFEFQADGDHFRIWVSDQRRPEKVELEDRSSGLQWFLSFYLVFLVESSRDHRNAILLLDEPGLSLHPLAQRDLSAFFESLATTNQIVYTTHSPFLVDADLLDRVRKVFVAADGSTKASADLRQGNDNPRKSGATYAIYSALNMNVAESILYGCHPVIVEGPSDQHYLATIKSLLIGGQKISPKRELVFPPSHGAKNAKVVASILTGRDETLPVMLLDGDAAGRKMATDMKNGLYQQAKDRVLSTDAYADFEASEIEDLFPASFLADVVDRWERRSDVRFSDVLKAGSPIVPQIEKWAEGEGLTFEEGWKVDLAREVKKRALNIGLEKFEAETVSKWTRLFTDFFRDH
ncbi:OLD family endonuclease [Pseudolabrys sp. Root1462]|uniref:AAA family ATPase n=1 Tax=Pseudolabrys sp. Root1462 TaxID=1736466 RepID=UPI0007034805|nr:AAA family ATPase [Pseudolabrys sp. Root1462]KQY98092.1 OLD family endonuclease [Pseudolabrys sp. Root1462]